MEKGEVQVRKFQRRHAITRQFYGIREKGQEKYMKNTNISRIGVDFVASYECKGMTLR
jgi:hypothetical protein